MDPPAQALDRQPDKIWLSRLTLDKFRNYLSVDLSMEARNVVLVGDNGAGKTNILEAVSLLTPGRGLRRAPYPDIAYSDGDGSWAIAAQIRRGADSVRLGTGLQTLVPGRPLQRKTRLDGETLRKSEDMLDYIRVLWLTPSMDGLFTGAASDRRRFIDRMVLAIDPGHGRRVSDYERAMRGRNRLLEERSGDAGWLDGIEAQLAALGTAIAAARHELVGFLGQLIDERRQPQAPFPHAILTLDGYPEGQIGETAATDLEDEYLSRLRAGRARDRAAKRTLTGPHRSDLEVVHGPKNLAASTCSTGEQKALLIGLVLAHAALVAKSAGQTPVVLLDEVAAHLDARRRGGLFDELARLDCQAWMTGTDAQPFAPLGRQAQVFEVEDGRIV